jgi:UDP-2-acetamido-3-amino-2,3-dideoxy-glucuronate N-acetyltransferase
MTPSQTPRVAVFGCGYWGQNLVRNFHQLGALVLVCDPADGAPARVETIAPGTPVETDAAAVLARPDVDAVVISTPAETHHRLSLAALAAGKDVFVEKPLALNYAQGIEIRRAAEKHGRIVMVGHLLEYHPAILRLRSLVGDGDLGRVNYIYSNRLNFGKIRTEENALWSFAPHDIAVILRLVGESPIEVTCSGGSYVTPNLADVTVSCLHFASGLRAHIFVSWLNPFKEQKLVVVGDRRMAVFNDATPEHKLVLYDQRVELTNRQPVLQKNGMQPIEIPADEPLRNECAHFLDCVRTRRTPLSDAASGIEVLRVLQACQSSLQLNGRPVVLGEAS